jgi:4-hydroxy-tetrahydrodipicolinate synthase
MVGQTGVGHAEGAQAPQRELRGIFPIVYTAFDAEGRIDEAGERRVIDYLIASGVHGLAGCGGASETRAMTPDERMWLAELTLGHAAGRVPVIIGTSAPTTALSVELSRHAERIGARGVFCTPATEAERTPEATRAHFGALSEAVGIPIFIQHAGIPLEPAVLAGIVCDIPNVRYVKEESARSGHMISQTLALAGERVRIFSGGSYLLDDLARGATGAVPGSICTADLARAFDQWMAGDHAGARRTFNHAVPLLYWRKQNSLIAAKEVLRRLGIIDVAVIREKPAGWEPLDEHDQRELSAIMEAMGPPY